MLNDEVISVFDIQNSLFDIHYFDITPQYYQYLFASPFLSNQVR